MSWMRLSISVVVALGVARAIPAEEVRAGPAAPNAPPAAPSGAAATLQDPHKTQLDAATIDAREALRQDILSFPLAPDLDVRRFIDRTTGGSEEVSQVVQDARQRGGTRWTTDETCEIRLEVSGADVAPALQKIAAANAARLPASREAIEKGLQDLKDRTFYALGKSTGPGNLMRLRPGARVEAWRNVNEADRREAVMTARNNAVARVVQSLRPVPIGSDKTLDDALNLPEVSGEIRDWVGGRPVTDVVFGDDLNVRLTLSAPPEELWPVIESTLRRHHFGPAPGDAKAWAAIRDTVYRDSAPAIGRSVATPAHPPNVPANAALPQNPPEWVGKQVDADATAQGGGLKAARAAEAVALERVRRDVDALPLNATTTLGEAAKVDPRIARARDGAIRRAVTTKVDYQGKGVVKVRVSLDLEEVWRALYSER